MADEEHIHTGRAVGAIETEEQAAAVREAITRRLAAIEEAHSPEMVIALEEDRLRLAAWEGRET